MGVLDLSAELGDFGETAAVIANLDLLVTVDSAAAHLAGALGRPAWTLLGASGGLALAARADRQPVVSVAAAVPASRGRERGNR